MSDHVKLCKDCRHYRRHWLFGWNDGGDCHREDELTYSMIDGKEIEPIPLSARYERFSWPEDSTERCGPDAKFFEPRT